MHGNAPLAHTTRNTLSILAAIGKAGAGKDEVDVHPGAAGPFCRREVHAADIHGTWSVYIYILVTVIDVVVVDDIWYTGPIRGGGGGGEGVVNSC